jgi:hypothetical protein
VNPIHLVIAGSLVVILGLVYLGVRTHRRRNNR